LVLEVVAYLVFGFSCLFFFGVFYLPGRAYVYDHPTFHRLPAVRPVADYFTSARVAERDRLKFPKRSMVGRAGPFTAMTGARRVFQRLFRVQHHSRLGDEGAACGIHPDRDAQ